MFAARDTHPKPGASQPQAAHGGDKAQMGIHETKNFMSNSRHITVNSLKA
jgi:hypothetical protein